MTRLLALLFAAALCAAPPASALSHDAWVQRAYSDVLLRSPTSSELSSAVGFLDTALQTGVDETTARMSVALKLLSSDEWVTNLIGADPYKPGYIQMLTAGALDPDSADYYRCEFKRFQWADEQIIASIIGSTSSASCTLTDLSGLKFLTPSYATYRARAVYLNPGLATASSSCGGSDVPAVIDQIYQDLLGRHATTAELGLPGDELDQVNGTLIGMGVGGSIGAPQEVEFLTRLVRSAFLRFYHRLPSELPGTAPDGGSELAFWVVHSRDVTRNEWFYAVLLSSAEYDTSVLEAPPVVNALVDVAPADVLVSALSLEQFGSPPPPLNQLISPLFVQGIITSADAAVTTLSAQVQVQEQALAAQQLTISAQQSTLTTQQQTITALAVDIFGGAVTHDGAAALIATAKDELTLAESQICPIGLPCTNPRIVRARAALASAQAAFDSGDYEEAARYARAAYLSAEKAIELNR